MFVVDGAAYAGQPAQDLSVARVKPLSDLCMLVTSSTGETRLFDATALPRGPAFDVLRDEAVFSNPVVVDGICTWVDGDLDVVLEFMYENSYAYDMNA